MEVSDVLFSLLRSALNKMPVETQTLDCLSEEMLSAVYRLSEKQDMSHMVGGYCLS